MEGDPCTELRKEEETKGRHRETSGRQGGETEICSFARIKNPIRWLLFREQYLHFQAFPIIYFKIRKNAQGCSEQRFNAVIREISFLSFLDQFSVGFDLRILRQSSLWKEARHWMSKINFERLVCYGCLEFREDMRFEMVHKII